MKNLAVMLFVFLVGCGHIPRVPDETPIDEVITEDPTYDPFEDCFEHKARLSAPTIPYSQFPVPFHGANVTTISTVKPEFWDSLPNSKAVYLKDIVWDGGSWIYEASLETVAGRHVFASWNGKEWLLDRVLNFRPLMDDTGTHLVMDTRVRARGVKPAGKPRLHSTITVWICEAPLAPPQKDPATLQMKPDAGDESHEILKDLEVPELPTKTPTCTGAC